MNLTDRKTHFEFGANWRDYAKTVDKPRIDSAIAAMSKLFPEGLAGKTFLDVGCGSGLHSLAALMLGAASVTATDIDENSVGTTRELLQKNAANGNWVAKLVSIFDTAPDRLGTFDVVYAWGVLHHTGDMWSAIARAVSLVAPGGQFAIAIYAKTPFDLAWKIEKRLYSSAPAGMQWILRQSFTGVLIAAKLVRGKNPRELFDQPLGRGMNLSNDLHDWLGGYPYETASVDELDTRISALGFERKLAFPMPVAAGGLLGSGCHELVFSRHG